MGLWKHDIPCVGLNGDRYHSAAFLQGSWLPYTGSVMAIDPSGRGSDETAVCVVKMLNGYLYLTAMKAFSGGYDDSTLEAIAKLAAEQKVNHVVIEANFGDGMFTKLIEPFFKKHHPCLIEEVKHSKQKEMRIIDTIEPVMAQHRLVVDRSLIQWDYNSTKSLPPEKSLKYMLFYQMSRITRERGALSHDDRLDCLSIAIAYWVEQMGQDADTKMANREAEILKKEMEAWDKVGKATVLSNQILLGDNTAMSFSFDSLAVGKAQGSSMRRR